MILPSLNALNCGNLLRATDTLPASDGPAHRKNAVDWTIRSEATRKRAERSTTTRSSLTLFGMANLARMGRVIALAFLALLLVWTPSRFSSVVQANVIDYRHQFKVVDSVVGLPSVLVVNGLVLGKESANVGFHNETMLRDISLTVPVRVLGGIDENVAVMLGLSWVVGVNGLDADLGANLPDSFPGNAKQGRYFLHGFTFSNHNGDALGINGSTARETERFHVPENELFADTMLIGDSLKRSKYTIILSKGFSGNEEFLLCHSEPPKLSRSVSLNLETRKSNDQDIVWTAPKDAEGRIKSLPITSLEIKKYGDTVHIRTVPDITIRDYTIGQKLVRERPLPGKVDLLIDKGKYYSISINDVEKLQADINYVEKWTDDAGQQMKIAVDAAILAAVYADANASNKGNSAGKKSGALAFGASGAFVTVDKTNILDYIVDMGTALDEQNVPETQRWLVFPAIFCGMIKKSDLKDASLSGDGTSIMRNGRIGIIDRFTVYSSNQIAQTTDGTTTVHNCIFGHPSAITFASQLTENRVIPNPDDFGDLMEGLQVYGYETIKAAGLGHFYAAKG